MTLPVGTTFVLLVAALCLEAGIGYPKFLYVRIGHPVTWIGALIAELDFKLNHEGESFARRRMSGVLATVILVIVSLLAGWMIEVILAQNLIGQFALVLLASTLFAGRGLYDHVRDVANALDREGLVPARAAVGRIVGRNPDTLDEAGVARAAIESLAENASDGVVAPALWFALLGFPGLVAYKAINTADSMIGHRTAKHEAFGWASARLDDLVNLPASRLTGLLYAGAARLLDGASAGNALRTMLRDAPKHRSPNAGWPESAVAGALGLKLNGPKTYGGELVEDAYMGSGRREATSADIGRALRLSFVAWGLMIAALATPAAILRG